MTRLGDLERQVMEVMWDDPTADMSVHDVQARFPKHAYTTLMTVLDHLRRKGLLSRQKDGRAFRYRTTVGREEYTARLMQEALGRAGDSQAVLIHFAATVSPEEAAILRAALEKAAGPSGRPKP